MAYMTHDQLKEMIETKIKGKLPAWVRGFDLGAIMPQNAVTGKLYRGVNLLLGMFAAEEKGSNIFATGRQWYELAKRLGYFEGGSRPLLRRDAHGQTPLAETFVVAKQTRRLMVDPMEITECPEEYREERNGKWYRKYSLFKGFMVYNLMDLHEDLIALVRAGQEKHDLGRAEEFETFVDGLGISFAYGAQPAYSPRRDVVKMPPRESFADLQHWGGVLLHEIGHWSGAKGRLGREGIVNFSGFGTDFYAEEEAVAEWFALLACNQFGLIREGDGGIDNHAVYIQGWMERFSSDPDLLTRTFREAEKAFAWVLEKSGVQIGVETEEIEAQVEAA